jgi:hypothetical protein
LQQHGGGSGRFYLKSHSDIAAELEQWRQDAHAFDHDPDQWQSDRLQRLHQEMLREGRLTEAHRIGRALAGLDQL